MRTRPAVHDVAVLEAAALGRSDGWERVRVGKLEAGDVAQAGGADLMELEPGQLATADRPP
jgi:hypothetical protein